MQALAGKRGEFMETFCIVELVQWTETKLQWLCEEAKEKETKEKKLRRLLQQGREQLKHLTFSKESERHVLLSQLEKQEQLLDEVHQAKRGKPT
uniref:Uncharacterized protein n=1 Tax=Sphaerodactylus townsendi TaxID=933632 RepID=A0ACB8G4Z8_9SAUR